jgi:hypothetical protein
LESVSREDWTIGGVALLLVITLLFLPWFSVSIGPFTVSTTATGDPDGWLGILAVLTAVALIADLAVERFSPSTELPVMMGSRAGTRFLLAAITAGFVALKFLFHVHFSYFAFGFYAAVILSGALVFFAMQARNAAGAAR